MPARTRSDEALDLREQGLSYEAIASMLGLASADSARGLAGTARRRRDGVTTNRRQRRAAAVVGRFGIEIEATSPSAAVAAQVLRAAGLNVDDGRTGEYHHNVRAAWQVKRDGSVNGHGIEVVSPPLPANEDGFEQVRVAMRALRQAGGTVDASCGMHVHVEVRSPQATGFRMTPSAIAAFGRSYVERQDVIDRFVPASRRRSTGESCRGGGRRFNGNEWDVVEAALLAGRAPTIGRYRTVNAAPFARLGTIEFRQHQGTLNGRKAVAWVKMLVALRDRAVAGTLHTLPTSHGFVVDLLAHEPRTAAYLVARAEALAPMPATPAGPARSAVADALDTALGAR